MTTQYEVIEPGHLAPILHRTGWVVSGLLVQLVGAGVPAGYVIAQARRMGIGGHITSATVRLAWRSDAHTSIGLTLLLSGLLVFALGSVLLARPFVSQRSTLLIAVPVAAVAGMLVLGVLAIAVAFAVYEGSDLLNGLDIPTPSYGGGGTGTRKKRREQRRI